MLKANKKCRPPSVMLGGVTLKHCTDTNRFAGIENKQTPSAPLQRPGSTSGCSRGSAPARELPVTDAHVHPRERHRRRCQSSSCPNGQGKAWKNVTSKRPAWIRPSPTERDVPYVWVRCLERAQARSINTPMTTPALLQKITQAQERNTEQWWPRIFALVWMKSATLRKPHF